MWVREDDLTLRPELKAADRTALKAYVMGCMPPPYARKSKVMKKEKGPIIKTPMKKTRFVVKAQKPVVKKQNPPQNIKRTPLLCTHEWEYGHTEPYCYKKKAGEPAKPHPGEEVLKKRMDDYVRRKEAELFSEITVVDQDGHRGFVFCEVEALILDVQEWDDLILGNEILSKYNLDPFSALKRRMEKGKNREEKPTFAKWVLDYMGEEESEMINVKSFYSGMNKELMDLENIDVGLGAAKSGQSDDNRMRAKIKDKVEAIDVVHFSSSPAWKTKFVELFESNFKAFGDAESSTQLSIITPIRCDLLPGERVGIQKQLPLGQKQENFLHKRIAHMEKAGIIYPNKNPTTAMSMLVVPKKGPKKFRLVVDFRPLNKIIQRVNNTLPRIELQLNRVRGNKFFAGFDLLSDFDYLACEEQAGQYFTFTTP
eukprot:augustus_masked-scaffold_26-processed-gene-2.4-mRNA-1 protein AED:1.00 eAED:1.00 QI:0/0/0/0/1/1/3/0/425